MRIQIIAAFCFVSVAFNLCKAQSPQITWSETLSKSYTSGNPDIFYADDNSIYAAVTQYKPYGSPVVCNLIQIDKNGHKILDAEVKSTCTKATLLKALRVNDNKFIYIYLADYKKERVAKIETITTDARGNITKPAVSLLESPYKKYMLTWAAGIREFRVCTSPDLSKVALFFRDEVTDSIPSGDQHSSPYKKIHQVMVIDTAGNIIQTTTLNTYVDLRGNNYTVQPPDNTGVFISKSEASTCGFCVNNNGNAYFKGGNTEIVSVAKGIAKINELITGGHVIHKLLMKIAPDGSLWVSGTYAEDEDKDVAGTFVEVMRAGDETFTVSDFKPFPSETNTLLKKDLENARAKVSSTSILYSGRVQLSKIIYPCQAVFTDGYVYFIDEVDFGSATYTPVFGTNGAYQGQSEGGINYCSTAIITIVDKNGKIINTIPIVKNQVAANDAIGTLSYSIASFNDNNNLCVLFNDKAENINAATTTEAKEVDNWNNTVGMLVKITPEGKQSREIAFKTKDLGAKVNIPSFIMLNQMALVGVALNMHKGDNGLRDLDYHIAKVMLK